jgi:hypothetical protein
MVALQFCIIELKGNQAAHSIAWVIMDGKRTLFQVGVTATAVPKRQNAFGSSSGHVEVDLSDLERGHSQVPNCLTETKIRERQHDYPWAKYVGPSHFNARRLAVHSWRCEYCEKDGNTCTVYKFKDGNDFSKHARQDNHKTAATAMSLRAQMLQSRESNAVKMIESVLSESGRLLVLVAFMVTSGIPLKLFSQVCSNCHC